MIGKFHYLIPVNDLVFNMVKYSLMSLQIKDSPTNIEIAEFKQTIRCVMDTSDNNQKYYVVKMGIDFSTPFKGLQALNEEEIKTELALAKYAHNSAEGI